MSISAQWLDPQQTYVAYIVDGVITVLGPADPLVTAWTAQGNTIAPAVAAPALPASVTDKQFFQAAAQLGIITEAEAETFMANGTFPAALAAAFTTLPAGEQFAAKMAILGARNFIRDDPFVIALSTAMGQTSAQVDTLFALAATL